LFPSERLASSGAATEAETVGETRAASIWLARRRPSVLRTAARREAVAAERRLREGAARRLARSSRFGVEDRGGVGGAPTALGNGGDFEKADEISKSARDATRDAARDVATAVGDDSRYGCGIFRGDDLFFLVNHPSGFFVEVLARVEARSGEGRRVFGGTGGIELAETVAGAAVLSLAGRAASAVADAQKSKSISESDIVSAFAADVWRVEAVLALLEGRPEPPPRANVVTRVARRLFSSRRLETDEAALAAAAAAAAAAEAAPPRVNSPRNDPAFVSTARALPPNTCPPSFEWSALPARHEDALIRFADARCFRCARLPRDPAVCLACGEVMCCADSSCSSGVRSRDDDTSEDAAVLGLGVSDFGTDWGVSEMGACAAHASRRACGAGSCCFLLLKSTRILIAHSGGRRAGVSPSPYLDQHGEEDEHTRRGRPLFLNLARAKRLERLWRHGALEFDSRATRSGRLGGERF
jgi:hypothetical protein